MGVTCGVFLTIGTRCNMIKKNSSLEYNTSQNRIVIEMPYEEYVALHRRLDNLEQLITDRNKADRDNDWIESEEVMRILGVSGKTWQNYRDQRLIPFSKIGKKIYVRREDLDNFLMSHRIEARNSQ